MSRRALVGIALLTCACGDRVEHIPGEVHELVVNVAFSRMPAARIQEIGSFRMELDFDGSVREHTLSFNAATRGFTWFDDPSGGELPTTGLLSIRLEARSIADQPLPIGGSVGPIDLGDSTAPIEANVLVSEYDTFVAVQSELEEARFGHAVALAGGGLLVVGGATAGPPTAPTSLAASIEWIDTIGSGSCSTTTPGACVWGQTPTPRVHHVALSLADGFAADCPHRDGVLIAGGEDASGSALADAYLFDPRGLTGAGAFTQIAVAGLLPRIGAVAYATRDCRIVIAGGRDDTDSPVPALDVLRVTSSGISRQTTTTTWGRPASFAAAAPLGNALDEVVLLGGFSDATTARDTATSFVNANGALDDCDLDDGSCNGAAATMVCPRAQPMVAALAPGDQLAPSLVVGDALEGCALNNVELARASLAAPFNAFIPVAVQPTVSRARGHTVTGLPGHSALVVGGQPLGQTTPTTSVERFVLGDGLTQTSTTAPGTFESLTPLTSGRAFHSMTTSENAIFLTGGWDGSVPLSVVEVLVPQP